MNIPEKTVERLLTYRVVLNELLEIGEEYITSRELAELANVNANLVRRDVMPLECEGHPVKGYSIKSLIERINRKLNLTEEVKVAIIGMGRLGMSLLTYFNIQHNTRFKVVAVFDVAPYKVNTEIAGCKVHHIDSLQKILDKKKVQLVILAVPDKVVSGIAKVLAETDIKGVLNFTSVPIKLPDKIRVNKIDITLEMEKLAFYSL